MKVLVVTNMWPGPAKHHFGIFVANRVEAYRRLGADVRVVANDDPRKSVLRKVAKYTSLLARAVWGAVSFRPEIVEGHYLRPTAILTRIAASVARCPYVLYAHGSDLVGPVSGSLVKAVRGAAEIHTNSVVSADRARHAFGDVTVVVSPPGVDRDLFAPGTPERGHVVFVGDLVKHKGTDVLLEAMTKLDSAHLTIVGDGVERARLEDQARTSGLGERVRWAGSVSPEQVADYLKTAWVAAVPSRVDALGQVAVEALCSGVPVVVSQVGGLGDVPGPDSGTVVEPDDADGLAGALEHWLGISDEQRASAAVAARERSESHDLDVVAAEALQRLGEIVSRGTS